MSADRDIVSKTIELPGTQHHFVAARSPVGLGLDDGGRYWENRYVEHEPHPFTKEIHPVGFRLPGAQLPG